MTSFGGEARRIPVPPTARRCGLIAEETGGKYLSAPLDEATCRRKVEAILDGFPSQRGKPWFTADLFLSLMRLRGMECNSPSGCAEAFYSRKAVLETQSG